MNKNTPDKIAINAVEIEIAGTKLKLSLEQIKELKKILEKAFPEKETVYVPTSPVIIHREYPVPQWPRYDDWRITCRAEAGNTTGAPNGTLLLSAT